MLNTWLALKQMSDALHEGRLDDALRIGQQPDVKAHHRGGDLHKQLALAFLERAKKQLSGPSVLPAWQDIHHAAKVGADPKLVEKFTSEAQAAAVREIRGLLEQGPATRVIERLAEFKKQKLEPAALAPLDEVARAWHDAHDLTQRGELNLAVNRLDATQWKAYPAVAAFRSTLVEQQLTFTERNADLQLAMEDRRWRDVIKLADQLLVIAPQYGPLRRARTLAWRELEPPTQVGPQKAPAVVKKQTQGPAGGAAAVAVLAPPIKKAVAEPPPGNSLPRRFILWIDGVGGFLVCLASKVSLGQASEGAVDIPLFADVSRLHAYISRDSEGYLLEALRPLQVEGQTVEKRLLKDGDTLTLGSGCQIAFHQPVAITNTARLEIKSRHKLPLSLDGVLLMDETCLLGDTVDAHVRVPGLKRPIALLRRKDELIVQSSQPFSIDGQPAKTRATLGMNSQVVVGDEFRFSLESITPQFGRVRI